MLVMELHVISCGSLQTLFVTDIFDIVFTVFVFVETDERETEEETEEEREKQ
jgi:hypothetical protein